jgi:hypothetical protein
LTRTSALGVQTVAIVTLVIVGCVSGVSRELSPPREAVITEDLMRTMRVVIDSFTRMKARPPNSFEEACVLLTPPQGPRESPRNCFYFLHFGDTIPIDGWRHALNYGSGDGRIWIRSAGPDGHYGNADDMLFDSREERRRVAAAAGCYTVEFRGWSQFPGNQMRLDTTLVYAAGNYAASPRIYPYHGPVWHPSPYSTGQDSVYVIWQAIEYGVHFHFRVYADSLTGFAFGGPYRRPAVTARRTACRFPT